MSLYLALFLLLLLSVLSKKKYKLLLKSQHDHRILCRDTLYITLLCATIILVSFSKYRSYDFEQYKGYYNMAPTTFDISSSIFYSHVGVLWALLFTLSRILGFTDAFFFTLMSAIMIWMVSRFVDRYCHSNKILALLYLYVSFYLVYPYIGFRQSMTICIFLGFMIPLIEKQQWKKYSLLAMLSALFHPVGLIYLITPPLLEKVQEIYITYWLLALHLVLFVAYFALIKSFFAYYRFQAC